MEVCEHSVNTDNLEIGYVDWQGDPGRVNHEQTTAFNVHLRCTKCNMEAMQTIYTNELDWEEPA